MLEKLKNGLIVSCQAHESEPMRGSIFMAAMAKAAEMAGAVGIRANGPENIRAIRAAVKLPIIGIYKIRNPLYSVYITPTVEAAIAIKEAGADIIAIDCTFNERESGLTAAEMIRATKRITGLPVMADISTCEEGIAAEEAGADLVATTLAKAKKTDESYDDEQGGYKPIVEHAPPSLDLISELCCNVRLPIIAEGRFWEPEQVVEALKRGAHAVVVGTAITRPSEITHRFVRAINKYINDIQ